MRHMSPFSKTLKTNVAAKFLARIDKHFGNERISLYLRIKKKEHYEISWSNEARAPSYNTRTKACKQCNLEEKKL